MKRPDLQPTLIGALIVAAWIAPSTSALATSCASPSLDTRNNLVKQKATIEVTGHDWFEGACEEPVSRGCGTSEPPPARPIQNVKLSMRPVGGERSIPLGTADADANGDFSVTIQLPQVPNGRYVLVGGEGVESIKGASVWITKDGSLGDR